jgi:hypothetical protein
MLQVGRSPVQVPDEVDFLNLPNPSSRTMALGSTQPLTQMSTRNLPGDKKRRHLSAECLKMWEPQPLATVRASAVCYRDKFTFYHKKQSRDSSVSIAVRL